MILQRIKYFVTVVDKNSFTEAAEICYISQSAISQQINVLEEELGVKLYKKVGRKFELTAAGDYFYKRGKKLLKEVEDIKNETIKISLNEESNLSIGYLASYDGLELSKTISEFSKVYPEVTITVFRGTHEDLYNSLKSGKASLVINDQRRAFSDEYENFILKQSPTYIEFSSNHPLAKVEEITTDELRKYPCILVASKEQEKNEQNFYENTMGIGEIFIFAESLADARLMALNGRGYILVERVNNDLDSPLIQRIVKRNDNLIVRTYCAFWPKRKSNYYIEEFASTLRKNFL